MEANNILTANILDILFDGRNKEYGAYDLRKTYNGRINTALGITGIIIMLLVGIVIGKTVDENKTIQAPDVITEPINVQADKEIIPPTPKLIKAEPARTRIYTPPIIVKDNKVPELPVEVDELDNAVIGTQNLEGRNAVEIIAPVEIKGSQALGEPVKVKEDPQFIPIEIEASFKGNWNAYVKKEIEKNIEELTEAGESGTCIVKFIVSKDGSVSNVEALTMKGTKLAEVAVNAIRKGPRWNPAKQNGNDVNAYRTQPVTFKIDN